jgi:hypothetical protein
VAPKSISDLVAAVHQYLKSHEVYSPGPRVLRPLFDTINLASLKTEEGKPLQLRVALVDPKDRDPDRPPWPRPSRWQFVELKPQIEFSVRNLVKLAKAADPWSSCLAVYFDTKGDFYIWGLIDQTVHFNTLLMREREGGYAQPGLFHVQTTGAADLTVYREWGFVARLAQDTLIRRQNRVFWAGPVSSRLSVGIEEFLGKVLGGTDYGSYDDAPIDSAYFADRWIGTLCRILISIQKYRHGEHCYSRGRIPT